MSNLHNHDRRASVRASYLFFKNRGTICLIHVLCVLIYNAGVQFRVTGNEANVSPGGTTCPPGWVDGLVAARNVLSHLTSAPHISIKVYVLYADVYTYSYVTNTQTTTHVHFQYSYTVGC